MPETNPFFTAFFRPLQGSNQGRTRLPANQYGVVINPNVIGRGSLLSFSYNFTQPGPSHDANPVLLVSAITQKYVFGLNLNYLVFPTIKELLTQFCENRGFSYYNIKGDAYITSAFRQYKRMGIRRVRKLDCQFLTQVINRLRLQSFDPHEIDQIRQEVRNQMNQIVNPPAQQGPPQV